MKKVIIAILIILVLVIAWYFLFGSEPRTKENSENETETTSENTYNETETVDENTNETSDEITENPVDNNTNSDSNDSPGITTVDQKTAFINANVEFTCKLLENPQLNNNKNLMEAELNEAYKKYGLPVDDDAEMIEILKKFENDSEVTNTIKQNTRNCE